MSLPGRTSAIASPHGPDSSLADWVEELSDRIQAGERVDPGDLADESPGRTEELRRLLPAIELMAQFGRSAAGSGPEPIPSYEFDVLGDFRIVREVGRGGMGVVYEAEQVSLGRRVALKILPFAAALDPRQLQRFQLEARAAACLHHTNIVPIHAVGSERGVPFYAMQFIEGRTLAQVIAELLFLDSRGRAVGPAPRPPDVPTLLPDDQSGATFAAGLVSGRPMGRGVEIDSNAPTAEHRPSRAGPGASSAPVVPGPTTRPPRTGGPSSSTRDRSYVRNVAGLGLQAAEALDHAHSHGILHRDIKPANLMLDAAGHLWVTDFGLAQIRGDSRLTLTGDLLGTLRYMSPEQALGKRVVIDERTDVYSLGVTLYELLTLRPAIGGKDRTEILRKVAEEEPVPLGRLNPSVPRDLETIIQKAMAKEPESRYATARELADDLRDFLDDRPIAARRPSVPERAVRWLRRHPSLATATAIVLVLATVGSILSAVIIVHEQRQTVGALDEAKRRLTESQFFNDVVFQTSPFSPQGGTLNADQILEFAEKEVAGRFRDDPVVEARIRHTLGNILRQRGQSFKRAGPHLARARELLRAHLGDDDPETLKTRLDYAYILFMKDRAEAIREIREVLAIQRRTLPPDHRDVIETIWRLTGALSGVDQAGAVRLSEQTVETSLRVRGPDDEITLHFFNLLAENIIGKGDFQRAIEMLSHEYRAQVKSRGPLSAATLNTRLRLGWVRWASGDLRGALKEYEPLRSEYWRVRKEDHPQTFACDRIPYLLLRYLGEHRAAAADVEENLDKWTRAKGERHDYVLSMKGIQALDRGDLETARGLLADLWRRRDKLPPPLCHLDTGRAYAEALAWSGDYEQAFEVAEDVIAYTEERKKKREYTEKHYLVAVPRELMARLLANAPESSPGRGDVPRALELAETTVEYFPRDAQFRTTLGLAQYRAGRWDDAIATLTLADRLDEGRRFAPRGFILAMAHWQKGEQEKALGLFKQSAAWMDEHRPGHPELLEARTEAAALLGLRAPRTNMSLPANPFAN